MMTPVLKTTTMMMTIMVMKNDAEVVEVSASIGQSVLLNSGLQTEQHHEARWTHKHLLVHSGVRSECDDGHCELLANGSLWLHHVTARCAGNYKLELFSSAGKLMDTKEFLLRLNDSSQSSAGRNAAICCSVLLPLLLIFITVLILRRRGMRRCPSSDPTARMDNVYMVMEQSKISQEEGQDASCRPDVSTETDIYV